MVPRHSGRASRQVVTWRPAPWRAPPVGLERAGLPAGAVLVCREAKARTDRAPKASGMGTTQRAVLARARASAELGRGVSPLAALPQLRGAAVAGGRPPRRP